MGREIARRIRLVCKHVHEIHGDFAPSTRLRLHHALHPAVAVFRLLLKDEHNLALTKREFILPIGVAVVQRSAAAASMCPGHLKHVRIQLLASQLPGATKPRIPQFETHMLLQNYKVIPRNKSGLNSFGFLFQYLLCYYFSIKDSNAVFKLHLSKTVVFPKHICKTAQAV